MFPRRFFFLLDSCLHFFVKPREFEEKVEIRTSDRFGHCYTSNPGKYLSLTMNVPGKKRKLYCLFYDTEQRRKGYYPQRKTEVALIGDSFVFGEGIKGEDTLGFQLSAKFKDINFRNFGERGADVYQACHSFLEIIQGKNRIKGVIYFYNLNDVFTTEQIHSRQRFINDLQNVPLKNISGRGKFTKGLLSKSAILALFDKELTLSRETGLTVKNYLDMYFDPSSKEPLLRTVEIIAAMDSSAKERGAGFVVAIYPLLYKDFWGKSPFLPIHQLLRSLLEKRGIRCVDLLPAFDKYYSLKKFTVHPIDYHPNGLANKIVTDYLAEGDKLKLQERK